jgi:cation-transporting ATPase E
MPALLVVGIPTLALAAWAQPGRPPRDLLRSTLPFALPAALSIGALEGTLYLSYLRSTDDVLRARTVLTAAAVLCGLVLILFVQPPSPAWTAGHELRGDRRPIVLVVALLLLFGAIVWVPRLRAFFELAPLAAVDLAIVAFAVALWGFGLRYVWRARVPQRLLGMPVE